MTSEEYFEIHDLRTAYSEESDKISNAINNFFAICDIAKKEFIEKSDWALENIRKLQERREILHKECLSKIEAINNKYKEESAGTLQETA